MLPACVALGTSLFRLLLRLQPDSLHAVGPSTWGLLAGFFLWLLLFSLFRKPTGIYVAGHEMTHALWALLMGGTVSRMNISKEGGSVELSKSNVFITLAPYFFPLYTFVVLTAYLAFSLFTQQSPYEPLWMGLVGFTWSFHITFTIEMLRTHQPDIREYGRLFSYAAIWACNLGGLLIWIMLVTDVTPAELYGVFSKEMLAITAGLSRFFEWSLKKTAFLYNK